MADFVTDALEEIRRQVQAADADLVEARARRDAVLAAAGSFEGVLETFGSGSIAHGTALTPAHDADCALVLDRRSYPALGPDGQGEGSAAVVENLRTHIRDALREEYPAAAFRVTKRAIVVSFGDDGPTVDLVVALNRKDAPGLWIPHTHDDSWDPSHPKKHTELTRAANAKTSCSAFARSVRLIKAWNNQFEVRLCSFNVEALALAAITSENNVTDGLFTWLEYAENDLANRLTPDPAGVSDPIKLPNGLSREQVSDRVGRARTAFAAARDADDDDEAADEMKKVFKRYETEIDKVKLDRILNGTAKSRNLAKSAASVAPILSTKQPRSWGGANEW